MRFQAEQVLGGELQPGDLFSTAGPEYWDGAHLNGLGERVYVRTETLCPPDQAAVKVWRIVIVKEAT